MRKKWSWRAHLKNIRGKKKRRKEVRVFEAARVGRGVTGGVLNTLGQGAPEVMGHLFLSHLHANRSARWFSGGLTGCLKPCGLKGALR